MTRSQLIQKGVDMSDTEEANKTMVEELERLRKRVNDLEAEVQDLRFKPDW